MCVYIKLMNNNRTIKIQNLNVAGVVIVGYEFLMHLSPMGGTSFSQEYLSC